MHLSVSVSNASHGPTPPVGPDLDLPTESNFSLRYGLELPFNAALISGS